MIQDKKCCVYVHKNKENGKIYIGITTQDPEKRWKKGLGYQKNIYFYRAIQTYGWDGFEHIILIDNISVQQANIIEFELIHKYQSNDPSKGYNMANGGNFAGSMAEETKQKLSLLFTGRKLSDEWIKNRTLSQTGLKRSDETCKKIRESESIKVICLNDRIVFSSLTEAANQMNISIGRISACCNKIRSYTGKDDFGNPLYWMFYDEYFNVNGNELSFEELKNMCLQHFNVGAKGRKTLCITTGEIFDTASKAAKKYNIQKWQISDCCKGSRKSAGIDKDGNVLKWEYID